MEIEKSKIKVIVNVIAFKNGKELEILDNKSLNTSRTKSLDKKKIEEVKDNNSEYGLRDNQEHYPGEDERI